MEKLIYMDNAATTRVSTAVFEKMKPYFLEEYGNPSSVYRFASKTKAAVEEAREIIAKSLNAKPQEIYFTAGGSESDNWAIKGVAESYKNKGKHIITSKIEHHAVLHTCEFLEKQGYEVTYLPVDEDGKVSLAELEKSIRPDTILISIMFANNEIGTMQDIKKIGEIAKAHNVLFHTDAVQAFGHVAIDVEELNIDLLSASGHKFHGPKGIGFLYVKSKVRLANLVHGGSQERAKRAGTTNVPGIIGMGEAAKEAVDAIDAKNAKILALRDHLIDRVMEEIPYVKFNGSRTDRLSNNANFSFRFIEGESLLILLDQKGICASSGSACTSGSLDPSHVLLAIGLPHEIAHGSLRLTLSEENTMKEVDFVVDELKIIVERLRNMSPLYEDFIRRKENV